MLGTAGAQVSASVPHPCVVYVKKPCARCLFALSVCLQVAAGAFAERSAAKLQVAELRAALLRWQLAAVISRVSGCCLLQQLFGHNQPCPQR